MLLAVVCLVGVLFVGLPSGYEVCSGSVVDTTLCENAQLRRAIFGSVLTGAGIIAASVIVAAAVVRTSTDKNEELGFTANP